MHPLEFLPKIKHLHPELYNDMFNSMIKGTGEVLRKHGFDVKDTDKVGESLDKCWKIICEDDKLCL